MFNGFTNKGLKETRRYFSCATHALNFKTEAYCYEDGEVAREEKFGLLIIFRSQIKCIKCQEVT